MGSDLLDVAAAAKVVARFASGTVLSESYLLDDLERHFDELVAQAEPMIAEETGFSVPSGAVSDVISRNEWASANVDSMMVLLGPMLKKVDTRVSMAPGSALLKMAYRPALGAQLGTVLGFLSQRVLGQYDLLLGRQNKVFFVGPNIVLIERRFGFVPRDFRLWVVLHELTHRAQFEGNPWLREHFLSSINGLLEGLDIDPRSLTDKVIDVLKNPKEGAPLGMRLLDPAVREKFDSLQAFMSVIEGHGNFVMDRIATRCIPTQPRMRAVFRSGATSGGPLGKLIAKILGLELKKAQYDQGQKFFDEVMTLKGSAGVAACFRSVEALPTLEEVRAPERWVQRLEL